MKATQNVQSTSSSGDRILCPHCQSPMSLAFLLRLEPTSRFVGEEKKENSSAVQYIRGREGRKEKRYPTPYRMREFGGRVAIPGTHGSPFCFLSATASGARRTATLRSRH